MLPRNQTGLVIGIGMVIAMMVVNAGVAYRETQLLHDDSQRVAHSHEVRFALGEVLSIVKDAETGQRGFIITGDASYLEPYSAALGSYQEETSALDKLIVDNPRQQEAAKRLKELIERRLGELAESIELRKEQGYEAGQQFVAKGRGKQTMQQIRAVAAEMQEYEDDLLADRERNHDRTYRSALMTDVVATVLGLAAVVAFGWLLRKHLSALMKSADQIHEHRELLRATLVSIGDGVIATDAAGRVTFLNTVAENLTGWSQTEAASKPLDTVFSIVNEATRKPVENPALRALREGRIVELANHTVLLSKDGTQWPIDDSAAPITGEGGEVNGVILVFREIRQRKIHEQELLLQTEALEAANQRKSQLVETLRQSEEQFRTLADSIPQLAWMSKNDGTIVWYNKRWYEFTGAAPGVMAGWGLQSALDPAELPRILAKFQAALASGEPWEDTFALRRHDGQMRWHLSRAMPLRDEQGQIVWWFGTNTDITEQLQMEDALKEADRRKDEFLAILAHELRNPLSPLSNALQLWPFVENDRASQARFDSQGRLLARRDADGQETRYEYTQVGDLAAIVSPSGARLDYQRDAAGRIASLVHSYQGQRSAVSYAYDAAGRLARYTREGGTTETYGYDALGRLTEYGSSAGNKYRYTYDGQGRTIAIEGPFGTQRSTYDSSGRVVGHSDPVEGTFRYEYSDRPKAIAIIDQGGARTRLVLNAQGQPLEIEDALSGRMLREYDAAGRLAVLVDAGGHRTTWSYDDKARSVERRTPLGRIYRYRYDEGGNLTSLELPDGRTIRRDYDAAGRLVRFIPGDGEPWTYGYDNQGRLQSVEGALGKFSYSYDAFDRLTQYRDASGATVAITYDAAGRRATLVTPDGRQLGYSYNARGLLGAIRTRSGEINYTYDTFGRQSSVRYPNGVTTAYEYSAGTRIKSITATNDRGATLRQRRGHRQGRRHRGTQGDTRHLSSIDRCHALFVRRVEPDRRGELP